LDEHELSLSFFTCSFMQNKIEFVSIFNLQVGLLGRVRFRRQAWGMDARQT